MNYEPGANGFVLWDGAAWVLLPACGDGTLAASANAVAVWTPGGWIARTTRLATVGANALTVRTALGDRVLLPVACGDAGCTGTDPLCGDCPCDAELAETYEVAISGFPAICYVGDFNGTWTVSWQSDCLWEYVIDAYHRVRLHRVGGTWRVNWAVTSPGGANGYFVGSGGDACDPTAQTYASYDCYEPMFCWGLCTGVGSASVVVSDAS